MRVSDSRSIAMILLCLAVVLCPSQAGAQNDRNRERKTRFSFLMLGAWAGPGSADDLKKVLVQAGFGDTPAWPGYGKDYPRSFGGSGGLEFEIGYEHPSAWGLAVSAGRADFGVVQGFRATSEAGEEEEYLAFRHSLRHLSPVVTYRLGPLRTSLGPTFVHARAKVEAPGLGQEKQETLKVGMEVSVGASSALLIPWLQVAVQARYRLVGSPEFGPFEAHDGAVPSFKVGFNHWQVGVGLGLRFEGSGVAGGPSTSDLPPTDVFAELGRGAGKDAAGSRRTLGYSVASILGGLPIGIWAPCSGQSDCRSLVLSGIAVVGITSAVALISSNRVPGELTHAFENEDPRYQEAFNTSYRNELRQRQMRSILRGTLTGAVAGLGLLLVLLPST